jgi:hypothetical protein
LTLVVGGGGVSFMSCKSDIVGFCGSRGDFPNISAIRFSETILVNINTED